MLSGCSGSCLPLGGVRVGCCAGVLFRVLRIMFAIGRCQGAVQGAVKGAPDHVCHWAGCCPGCCPGCCLGVLSRGAVQGAPDHVIGRCQGGAVQGTREAKRNQNSTF